MHRFRAAAPVAAFFLIGICSSPLVHGDDDSDRGAVSMAGGRPLDSRQQVGSLDVTAAVDGVAEVILDAVRGLRRFTRLGAPAGEVDVAELDNEAPFDAALTLAALSLAYDSGYDGGSRAEEMPALRRKYAWQLTYRSDVPDSLAPQTDLQFDRFPGMNITLDDAPVVGLRFELDYGWKR